MKKFLMAVTAISTLGVATPALADGDNTGPDVEVFRIRGANPAKCNLESASGQIVNLGANDISDRQGVARASLARDIANGLEALGITAWCTGNENSLVLSRSALTTGNGNQTNNGFNRAVIYDLEMNIPATRRAGGAPVNEGTTDGPGNGPGVGVGTGQAIGRFGPVGAGEPVTFRPEPGQTVSAVADGLGGAELPRNAFTTENAQRLVAGNYNGTVTITLTPGA